MARSPIYRFEEIGDDLGRPPMAAVRALLTAGVLLSPKGWAELARDARRTIANEGARERVDLMAVRTLVARVPANHVKLVTRAVDPDPAAVPDKLATVLGPTRSLSTDEWKSLTSLDRYVLATLAYNTRLLSKAIDELVAAGLLKKKKTERWSGALARCDVTMSQAALERISSPQFLEGRALVLARTAGRRAARRGATTFDLRSELEASVVELEWGVEKAAFFWQAHVSAIDGSFFPAASLAAAATAGIALVDMLLEIDPTARVSTVAIVEEAWLAGKTDLIEPATQVLPRTVPAPSPSGSVDPNAGKSTPPDAGSVPPPPIAVPPAPPVPRVHPHAHSSPPPSSMAPAAGLHTTVEPLSADPPPVVTIPPRQLVLVALVAALVASACQVAVSVAMR